MPSEIFTQPVDHDALTLARAIALRESSSDGNTPNYNASGDNGTSLGAYQWNNGAKAIAQGQLPENFTNAAKKYGLDPNDFSPANQDKVAYAQVKEMKDQGLEPAQVAAAWNAGPGHINDWQNHVGTTTVNGKELSYNTPAYVDAVHQYFQKLQEGSSETVSPQAQAAVNAPVVMPQPNQNLSNATFPASPNDSPLVAGLKTVGNIPSSAYGFLKNTLNTLNPYNIGQNIGADILGTNSLIKESGGVGQAAKNFVPEFARNAVEAVVPQAAQQLVKGNTEGAQQSVTNDPVGQILPFLMLGRKAAEKAGVGAQFSDTISNLTKPAPVAVGTTAKLLSYTSDVPEAAFKQMLEKPVPVKEAIKAGTTPEIALDTAQQGVRQLRKTLTTEWQEGADQIINEFRDVRVGLPDRTAKSLESLAEKYGFENTPQNTKSISVNEMMGLLKELNEIKSKPLVNLTADGIPIKNLYDQLQQLALNSFGGKEGNFAKLYKNYAAKKSVFDSANKIVAAYKRNDPIAHVTAQNRLQAIFDDNKVAYLDAIKDLERETGLDILSKVTASKFGSILPSKTAKAAQGLAQPKGVTQKLIDLLAFPLTSPRMAGAIARGTQNTAKVVTTKKVPIIVGDQSKKK